MRIKNHPRLRRLIAIVGLIIILGHFLGMIYILMTGQDPVGAFGLFISMTIFSVCLYVFLMYVRHREEQDK